MRSILLSLCSVFLLASCSSNPTTSRSPASENPLTMEPLVMREGISIKCESWSNPYRSANFELRYQNATKNYRVVVGDGLGDIKRMTPLKKFENKDLWCVFGADKSFICTTQDLRSNGKTLDTGAESFSVKRRIRSSLDDTSNTQGVMTKLEDYLDYEISGEDPATIGRNHLPYNFFKTSSCTFKSGWSLFK